MRVSVFLNALGLGGTEKAASRWARGLQDRGHAIQVLTLEDGPRRTDLESAGLRVQISPFSPSAIANLLREWNPDVIHCHAPGFPHKGDILGGALALLPNVPVVQTNVFGRLENPAEDIWTDYRLFISWTSCVQASKRSFRPLNETFFQRTSVVPYPVDPDDRSVEAARENFRRRHNVGSHEILFGRLSRPDPEKWTDLPLDAFFRAQQACSDIKLLLREPPAHIARAIAEHSCRNRIVVLPVTADSEELRDTIAALDVVLHASSIGESFGYGIAEPMNLGKPVITNSTPWADQAQLELVGHGEGGYIASTPQSMAEAMLIIARDGSLREQMGRSARQRVRAIADATQSLDRLETILRTAVAGGDNPFAAEDLKLAISAERHLSVNQYGATFRDQLALRPFHYQVRFSEWRAAVKARLARVMRG